MQPHEDDGFLTAEEEWAQIDFQFCRFCRWGMHRSDLDKDGYCSECASMIAAWQNADPKLAEHLTGIADDLHGLPRD